MNSHPTLHDPPEINRSRELPPDFDDRSFFPKGAIAFFFSLLLGFSLIWFALYFLMLDRQLQG